MFSGPWIGPEVLGPPQYRLSDAPCLCFRYVCLLWATGIRKAPKLKPGALKVLLPIGFAHALGHAGAVIALGAGAVSFAQTVKAAEPLFTCLLSFVFLGTTFKSAADRSG